MNYLLPVLMIGIGATGFMDLWVITRKRLLGVPPPNYGLVGRWIAHMGQGRFRHDSIATASPAVGEKFIGWLAHYLTGIAFAALLVLISGAEWIQDPRLGPAIVVGAGTVAAPFLLMQPAMGAGIAASKTPNPAAARLQSLVTHIVFGIGLYVAARITRLVLFPG